MIRGYTVGHTTASMTKYFLFFVFYCLLFIFFWRAGGKAREQILRGREVSETEAHVVKLVKNQYFFCKSKNRHSTKINQKDSVYSSKKKIHKEDVSILNMPQRTLTFLKETLLKLNLHMESHT